MFSLAGRVALVTGSSRGLGRAMAMALGAAGARVALNYHGDADGAQRTLTEFRGRGHQGAMFRASVIDEADVRRLAGEIAQRLGPVDILVVNATCDQPHYAIEDYTWEGYQAMLDYFVKSPFLLTRAVLPHMKQQRWGRIINIGSEVFQRGVPNFSAYVAAKGGQNGWTRSMATELAPFGITVNMISPGWIPLPRHDKEPQQWKDDYRAIIPMNRWGVPEDVGGGVVFLASEEASFITGQDFCINGGLTVG